MSLVLVTAPTSEPVTRSEAKAYLRLDGTDEDALIDALITAARQHAETFTRRAFVTQTWRLRADTFPTYEYEFPLPPLQAVTGVAYTDITGVSQTVTSTVYSVDTDSQPGRLYLADAQFWPNILAIPHAVSVTFKAGYGGAGAAISDAVSIAAVPQTIKTAIKMLVAHWFENREPSVTGTIIAKFPLSVESILLSERWGSYS